jgi:hypothetical protein
VHERLKEATGQKTVPYVYINGVMVGGCDATKALIASGEFYNKLGQADGADGGAGGAVVDISMAATRVKMAGVDDDAPRVVGALFQFPNTVDNRVIRLTGGQVFVLSTLIAIFSYRKDTSWHWVSVGLLVDFCLRVATIRHDGHVNGAWQMGPVGNLITAIVSGCAAYSPARAGTCGGCSLMVCGRHDLRLALALWVELVAMLFLGWQVGPIVDRSYTEVSFLWFGFGVIMYLTLFITVGGSEVLTTCRATHQQLLMDGSVK